ncbi:MAG TPA: hypothetical protein VGG19_20370 [Tepidisphaeraceae bacterium]
MKQAATKMKPTRLAVLLLAASFLGGCCETRKQERPQWEYKTLVLPNDAIPLQPSGTGWASNDAVLNSMLKDGWVVAGYSVDHINSQWFLLKRRKY